MINAFQDVDPHAALKTFRRIISPQGLVRINVISRELREENLSRDEDFDRETGCFHLTRCPSENVEPLGFIERANGKRVPYYRRLRSYYRPDLERLLRDGGFEIISAQSIILPRDIWIRSSASDKARRWEDIIKKYGGYPGSVDTILRPI
ncbi:Uncharacterised protein [uncultured archaeon]|nr:Uncharacterised protein [uncultured archaeon]